MGYNFESKVTPIGYIGEGESTMSSCCTPDGSRASTGAAESEGAAAVYTVTGMTCGHCESAVSQEISALAGVTNVAADAKTGTVTVTSARPLEEDAVRVAVDEAGYELVGRA
jgi:copper chaperone CopZ